MLPVPFIKRLNLIFFNLPFYKNEGQHLNPEQTKPPEHLHPVVLATEPAEPEEEFSMLNSSYISCGNKGTLPHFR